MKIYLYNPAMVKRYRDKWDQNINGPWLKCFSENKKKIEERLCNFNTITVKNVKCPHIWVERVPLLRLYEGYFKGRSFLWPLSTSFCFGCSVFVEFCKERWQLCDVMSVPCWPVHMFKTEKEIALRFQSNLRLVKDYSEQASCWFLTSCFIVWIFCFCFAFN